MVERHQKQAAEVVPIPLLWRGARQGGMVERRLEQAAEASRKEGRRVELSFPHQRECIYKPLDSSLRWNDNGVEISF